MIEVKCNGKVHAIFGDVNKMDDGTTFIGAPGERLQFSVLRHKRGKVFQSHIHKHRPRLIRQTQESWVVLKGIVKVFIFDEKKKAIHMQIMLAGQFYVSYMGGHGYEILEDDTIVIENKLGDFIGVDEDKEKF
jgi:hypothetical protein